MSDENLLMILPSGVMSKKDMGHRKIFSKTSSWRRLDALKVAWKQKILLNNNKGVYISISKKKDK